MLEASDPYLHVLEASDPYLHVIGRICTLFTRDRKHLILIYTCWKHLILIYTCWKHLILIYTRYEASVPYLHVLESICSLFTCAGSI